MGGGGVAARASLDRAAGRGIRALAARLAHAAGVERERWPLWLPVILGGGIALYFQLAREPPIWVAPCASVALLGLALTARVARLPGSVAILFAALVALGFMCAQGRSIRVAAPVLAERWGPGALTGRVVSVEIRPEGRRVILDRLTLGGVDERATPERVRVRLLRAATSPVPGETITLRATLVPPPLPVAPEAYDFARQAWFERLGGVGSSRASWRVVDVEPRPAWRIRLNAARAALVERVLAIDPGAAGQITAALLTGEMGQVEPALMQAMRDSGLAHLLSISGLHISLVAGIVFLAVRRGLALVPAIALRWPLKKIAAIAALMAITFYALFAAPGVPTTRAWVMGVLLLLGVVVDRATVTLRLVAVAATAILVTMPEAMLGPSFQMSFAAVVALVAAWEALSPRLRAWRENAGWLRRSAATACGMLLTTLVAGTATAPFALYHFNRVTLLGVVANLVAVPLTSILVMPAAVLTFLAWPLGLERTPLEAMNLGNHLVVRVAEIVASWPGATRVVPTMPDWGLGLVTLGGLWLALWTGARRWWGMAALVVGLASPALHRPPDIQVSGDGRALAIRGARDELAIAAGPGTALTVETWLRRAGGAAGAPWPSDLPRGCSEPGCVHAASGSRLIVVHRARDLALACRDAAIVVTVLEIWRDCRGPALVIDRTALQRDGGHAVRIRVDRSLDVLTVRGARGERPWTRAVAKAPASSRRTGKRAR